MKRKVVIDKSNRSGKKSGESRQLVESVVSSNGGLDSGIVNSPEISELQGSLQELNNDDINPVDRTSGIDLRTRLHNTEIASITVLDTLVQFNFLPMSIVPFTLQKKRLAVSLKGKGRGEIVDIVKGKRDDDVQKGSGLFGGLFKKKDKEM